MAITPKIPLFKVYMNENVQNHLLPVLHSGYIGEGPKSAQFEKRFGEFIRNPNVAVVNSGTSALVMALRMAGVRNGHYVISTPETPLPTNMAILSMGAGILSADVLPDGTMDPASVNKILDDSRWFFPQRPAKAIMCVDWGGTPCKIAELQCFGLPVIEDACQAVGSYYRGNHVGSDADYTAFSFQAIKHLTTGDGGAVAFLNPEQAERARLLRWFGLDRTKGASMRCTQDPPDWGYKMQLNDIAASIGLANLEKLPWLLQKTKAHASYYDEVFGVAPDPARQSGYWLYTILVQDKWALSPTWRTMGLNAPRCQRDAIPRPSSAISNHPSPVSITSILIMFASR